MQISEIEIKRFRSIDSILVSFEDFTVILGSNNCGKSTILHAINIFSSASPKISIKDFHNHDTTSNMSIAVEFKNLTPGEMETFAGGIVNRRLRVIREFSAADMNPNYAVVAKINPGFSNFRDEASGTKKRTIYSQIKKDYEGLPSVQNVEEMSGALIDWEAANPDKCVDGRIKAFFGATNVAAGKLAAKTGVHFVPAVRDISQDAEGLKSPAVSLLADINKQAFENQKELVSLVVEFNKKLEEITNPKNISTLDGLSEALTSKLKGLYLDSALVASLESANKVEVSFPSPSIKVLRDDLTLDVSQVGHGLQRAILFTIIQFLAERNAQAIDSKDAAGFTNAQSDIIILIEEPELYQHPIKQKIIYDWFKEITRELIARAESEYK